jgi:CheY-like chemotaxis protein
VKVCFEAAATRTVDGDPSQINQALVNLVVNASEAMPGGGMLTVRTADADLDEPTAKALDLPPGSYLRLEVCDTGVGMSAEVRSHLFEPFFTTKARKDQPGTGLGLPTVYGVVQVHRGALRVESAPGRGTTFALFLPQGSLAPGAAPLTPSGGRSSGGLVLVVDDEATVREFSSRALSTLGWRAVTASDGEEGVRAFGEHHRALAGVLLDLKMPGMSGSAAFREMRRLDPAVPILICSGFADNEEVQALVAEGAQGLLEKPFQLRDLARQLERIAPATSPQEG